MLGIVSEGEQRTADRISCTSSSCGGQEGRRQTVNSQTEGGLPTGLAVPLNGRSTTPKAPDVADGTHTHSREAQTGHLPPITICVLVPTSQPGSLAAQIIIVIARVERPI